MNNDNQQSNALNELNIGNNSSNTNNNQNNNRFINNVSNVNSTNLDLSNNNQNQTPTNNMNAEDAKLKAQVVKEKENQFIKKQSRYNETSLNDLNVDGKYNKLEKSPYSDDENVRENIKNHEKKTVNITVGQEMKLFLVIAGIMLIFIIIMPFIFDLIENIRFH